MPGGMLKEIKRKWMHFEPRVVGRLSFEGKNDIISRFNNYSLLSLSWEEDRRGKNNLTIDQFMNLCPLFRFSLKTSQLPSSSVYILRLG